MTPASSTQDTWRFSTKKRATLRWAGTVSRFVCMTSAVPWLLDFFHRVARLEQVRSRRDDPFPRSQPLKDRHLVSDQRARADGEGLGHRSSILLLQAVDEV